MSHDPEPTGREARTERIFVYGTLRTGGAAGGLLAGGRALGEATLRGSLYDVQGRFPALVLGGDTEVQGELWEVPAARLAELDAYEGVDQGLYRRARAEADGTACWVYTAGPALLPQLSPEHRLAGGRWPPPA